MASHRFTKARNKFSEWLGYSDSGNENTAAKVWSFIPVADIVRSRYMNSITCSISSDGANQQFQIT
jgi:hypothetical protein